MRMIDPGGWQTTKNTEDETELLTPFPAAAPGLDASWKRFDSYLYGLLVK